MVRGYPIDVKMRWNWSAQSYVQGDQMQLTEFLTDSKALDMLTTINERGKQTPKQLSHVLNLPIESVDKYIHEAQYLKLVNRTRKMRTTFHRDDFHMEHFHTHIVLTDEGIEVIVNE